MILSNKIILYHLLLYSEFTFKNTFCQIDAENIIKNVIIIYRIRKEL